MNAPVVKLEYVLVFFESLVANGRIWRVGGHFLCWCGGHSMDAVLLNHGALSRSYFTGNYLIGLPLIIVDEQHALTRC
jgi:hypothetical protein